MKDIRPPAGFVLRPLSFVLLFLLGCGPGRGDLGGQVTFQGKAVLSGSVVVVGTDNVPRTVPIERGAYLVKDVPAGPVRLAVSSPDPKQVRIASRKPAEPIPPADRTGWFPVPARYGDVTTSGLTTAVQAGRTAFDVVLE